PMLGEHERFAIRLPAVGAGPRDRSYRDRPQRAVPRACGMQRSRKRRRGRCLETAQHSLPVSVEKALPPADWAASGLGAACLRLRGARELELGHGRIEDALDEDLRHGGIAIYATAARARPDRKSVGEGKEVELC